MASRYMSNRDASGRDRDKDKDKDRDKDTSNTDTNITIDNDTGSIGTNISQIESLINSKSDIWKPEHEKILSEWADKAMCYRWMHFKSYLIYYRKSHLYTIPVIIISTLTGTANFAASKFNWEYTSSVIGAFNIIAGIVTTIQQFLKINELTEGHRIASLTWDKFYRNIKVELSKCVDDRVGASQMLKMYKEEYDRLMETCPIINKDVILQFNQQFKNSEFFEDVQKPEICNVLIPTARYVYKDPALPQIEEQDEIIQDLKTPTEDQIRAEAVVAKFREASLKLINDKKIYDNFITDFKKINMRNPLPKEIQTNLKSKIEPVIINKFIEEANSI